MDRLEIGGLALLIDMDAMSDLIVIEPKDKTKCEKESNKVEAYDEKGVLISTTVTTNTFTDERQIDASKYEVVRLMLDILLTYTEEIDSSLGFKRGMEKLPINIKLAINTLMKYNILIED